MTAEVFVESLFDEIRRYVRFSESDERLLASFEPHLRRHLPRIVEEFYDRIREHEHAYDVLAGEAQVARLKMSLSHWLTLVCTGPHDQAYVEETSRIGRTHVRVGLPQHYMFTAMSLIRLSLARAAEEELGGEAPPVVAAIHRALDLALAVMLESYREDFVARIQRVDRLEREEVGRTLARTEHRYRHAVELSKVLFVGLDAGARICLFNREAERVTGFGREEVLGRPFADLLPDELRDAQRDAFEQAASGLLVLEEGIEGAVRTKAGKMRDVRWQAASSASQVDEEVVLFLVGQDTTDEKALAARVRQSEKLAAVGTLAAGLAHEIRNPLNGAHLHLTFLERGLRRVGLEDPEVFEAVGVVGEEIKRLGTLVSEFLDFARPRPLEKRRCSVRVLCERAVQLVSAGKPSSIRFALDLPSVDVEVEVDGDKIQQVLLNILQNAVEALAPLGSGSVVVRVRRQPRHVTVEIEDDGPGLPSAEAPIFDAFFSTKPQGTGLGLAIAHRIVTDHEGLIDVESRPGCTIFRVTLPLRLH